MKSSGACKAKGSFKAKIYAQEAKKYEVHSQLQHVQGRGFDPKRMYKAISGFFWTSMTESLLSYCDASGTTLSVFAGIGAAYVGRQTWLALCAQARLKEKLRVLQHGVKQDRIQLRNAIRTEKELKEEIKKLRD